MEETGVTRSEVVENIAENEELREHEEKRTLTLNITLRGSI